MKSFYAFVLFVLATPRWIPAADLPEGWVVAWGNGMGIIAPGSESNPSPSNVVVINDHSLSNAVAVVAGEFHALALRSDGTVAGFGLNQAGQATGVKSINNSPCTNGLVRINGRVLSNVVAIAAGRAHSLALQSDGHVVGWGDAGDGRMNIPRGTSNIVAIAAAPAGSLFLRNDGTVLGANYELPSGWSNIVAIAAGLGHWALALQRDGTVVRWGPEEGYGATTPPPWLSNVTAIAVGWNHSLALRKDGTVVGWGYNTSGQATGIPTAEKPYVASGAVTLGGEPLSNVVAIAASDENSLALKSNGTVVGWGNRRLQTDVPVGLSNVVAIAAGEMFCLAITTNPAVAERFRR